MAKWPTSRKPRAWWFLLFLVLGTCLWLWQGAPLMIAARTNVTMIDVARALTNKPALAPEQFFHCKSSTVVFDKAATTTTAPRAYTPFEHAETSPRVKFLLAYLYSDYSRAELPEKQMPHDVLSLYISGLLMAQQGKWEAALTMWGRAGFAKALHRMGRRSELGVPRDRQCAIAFYRLAIEVDPKYMPAYVSLGYSLWNAGDSLNAAPVFGQVSGMASLDYERYLYLGHARHLMGRYREAVDAYRMASQSLEADSESTKKYLGQAYLGLGRQLYRDGEYRAALDSLQTGLALTGPNGYGQMYLGDLYLALGDCQRAGSAYKVALELASGDDFIQKTIKSEMAKCTTK